MHNTIAQYGERTAYNKDEPLRFPDFTITFVGTTSEKFEMNPNIIFTTHLFDLTIADGKAGTAKERIHWSSGTGLIAPRQFSVGKKRFQLELSYWERGGVRLADGELVISPVR